MNAEAEKARITNTQLRLFDAPTVGELLARCRLDQGAVRQLYYDGHLSFEPSLERRLQPAQQAELEFVGHLARMAGARHVGPYLADLARPYAFDMWQLVYDFAREDWVHLGPGEDEEAAWPA